MRKQNQLKVTDRLSVKNPVAKFAHQFNKAQIFTDKRQYQRKGKHAGQEPFSIAAGAAIEKGFMVQAVYQGFQTL